MRWCFCIIILNIFIADVFSALDSRTLGMGGAFLAVGEDIVSINYNPAGIYHAKEEKNIKEIKIIDIPITGDFVTFINTMVNISTSVSYIEDMIESKGYIDLNEIKFLNTVMEEAEEIGTGYNEGALTETGLGSIMLYPGQPALSVTPKIYLGIEPMINVDMLKEANLKITTGTLQIIDFSNITASTETPPLQLLSARDSIKSFIDSLVSAGAQKGIYTEEQIANSLINQALSGGMSETEIEILASDVENFLPLFNSMYVIITSTCPELYLDYELGFIIKDLNTVELTVGFAYPLEYFQGTSLEGLVMGVNLKYIMGETIYKRLSYAEINYARNSNYDLIKPENRKKSNAVGMDIGLIFDRKKEWGTRFALSIMNINAPSFEKPPSAEGYNVKYELMPSAKIGVAFWPLPKVTLASDIDILRTRTFLSDYYTQNFSAGMEAVIIEKIPDFALTLRSGIRDNLASSDDTPLYSIGAGITFMSFTVDLALAYSANGVPYGKFPEYIEKYFRMLNFNYVPETWEFAIGFSFKFLK